MLNVLFTKAVATAATLIAAEGERARNIVERQVAFCIAVQDYDGALEADRVRRAVETLIAKHKHHPALSS